MTYSVVWYWVEDDGTYEYRHESFTDPLLASEQVGAINMYENVHLVAVVVRNGDISTVLVHV